MPKSQITSESENSSGSKISTKNTELSARQNVGDIEGNSTGKDSTAPHTESNTTEKLDSKHETNTSGSHTDLVSIYNSNMQKLTALYEQSQKESTDIPKLTHPFSNLSQQEQNEELRKLEEFRKKTHQETIKIRDKLRTLGFD